MNLIPQERGKSLDEDPEMFLKYYSKGLVLQVLAIMRISV